MWLPYADKDGSVKHQRLDGPIPPGGGAVVCSRDLHAILDCDGNIVEECGSDKACGKGKCVAPCEAAALNEGSVGCSFVVPKQNPLPR